MGVRYHDLRGLGDDKYDTAMRRIFGLWWSCRTKQINLIEERDVRAVGLPTTLDGSLDEELYNTMVDCNLTIADMAELFYEGLTFEISNRNALREIYDEIVKYIHLCAEVLNQRSFNSELIKDERVKRFLEDIQKLEDLANALYPRFMQFKQAELPPSPGFGRASQNIRRSISRVNVTDLNEEERRVAKLYHLDIREHLSDRLRRETALYERRG